MKFNIDWALVGIIIAASLPIITTGSLLVVWEFQMNEQEIQNKNTEARCKTVGGEMGYSKCYKNGKEI
nr:MAG TPA: hypothetical protein [Caudoviricetes sp.]